MVASFEDTLKKNNITHIETIHKLAIVVVVLFTLALGFGILRGNMKTKA